MKDRAQRRKEIRRLKNKRKHYWGDSAKTPKALGKLVHTAAICSCMICRNPRRTPWKEETMQEKRQEEKERTEEK